MKRENPEESCGTAETASVRSMPPGTGKAGKEENPDAHSLGAFFLDRRRRNILLLCVSGAAVLASLFQPGRFPVDPAWAAVVFCGLPIVGDAAVGLFTRFDIKADLLVTLALIASIATGQIFAAGEVAVIMQLGALLEEATVARARAGIGKLVHLTPRTARVLRDGAESVVAAEQVQVGDILRVLPGETIAVDGVIVSGQTAVDQSVMTGESLPVDKQAGDGVSSGTVNQFGSFDMRAVKVGEDSSLQRMIRLVRSADAGRAKIVGIADRWATWIVVIALVSAGLTWLISGQIIRSVTILVVFCPCALVLATPTAIMAGIGNAARYGVLVREGDALERLSAVKRITFDKTGTLTHGKPKVTEVHSFLPGLSDDRLLSLVAGAELRSEHPLGKAVLAHYQAVFQKDPQEPRNFQMLPGRGVAAEVGGHAVLAGNPELLGEFGVAIPEGIIRAAGRSVEAGCTVIYAGIDGGAAGFLALADTLREDAADVVGRIEKMGVRPVLLTGDHRRAAAHIAGLSGIRELRADCLPEDKLSAIDGYQKQGLPVCMVGDGVNDAPALKRAHVGIALGGIGSDIAVDAADIVLVRDDIRFLPHLLGLAKRMMGTIRLNMTFSMALNFVAIALAMLGILDPVVGALVHNAGSVAVILNSSLLLKWKEREK